jgi:hypothetical protein
MTPCLRLIPDAQPTAPLQDQRPALNKVSRAMC